MLRIQLKASYVLQVIHRAFSEFLALPTLIITGFLALSVATFAADKMTPRVLEPLREILGRFLSNPQTTADLLGTIGGSLITVTAVTISLLLVAVQQSAGAMTAQVFDQFLRRRHNQFHFGFFVGLSLFAVITLSSVDQPFNPVFGAFLVVALTVVALYLLIVLLYATIDQMRPVEIIETIHDHVLSASHHQRRLLESTRSTADRPSPAVHVVRADRHGFVTHIDVDRIAAAARACSAPQVILRVSTGSYVAFHDPLADAQAGTGEEAGTLGDAVRAAIRLERQRDIRIDPAYGIAQLETIAWTSISTSKSDPAPGILTIYAFRDLLARWSADEHRAIRRRDDAVVVYVDNTIDRLMDAFETLAVCSSESMQHQSLTAILLALTSLFGRLPAVVATRAENVVLRILPSLGDHVLTAELDQALLSIMGALQASGSPQTAAAVGVARRSFARTVGQFASRSSRAG